MRIHKHIGAAFYPKVNFISGYFVGFAVTLANSNFGTGHKADETEVNSWIKDAEKKEIL